MNQPRFQSPQRCKYKKFLGDANRWLIVELEQRKVGDPSYFEYQDDEADLYRENIREHIVSVIAQEIDSVNTGAVVTSYPDAVDGYYLVKWSGTPYTYQDTGELVFDGYF